MSYVALYRKWRPDEFEEVKGQEHVITTLKNQITHDRIGHAYLFCGTRGTGKTTVAKLFAKAVNCEHPLEDGSPCNQCEMCKAINAGSSLNVREIDAASNNGIDNMREIRDDVQYSPPTGKYKVYIIDEAHQISKDAFNALLKTIEEPPPYVIFILATTELHRIPITILSRCQRYEFRRISLDIIYDRLMDLLKREGVDAEEKAVRYVAKVADGSMRDALSLLDQCIAFYLGQKITYENVLEILGVVDIDIFNRLMGFVSKGETMKALEIIDEVVWKGRELSQFVLDFIWYMRNLLLIKSSEGMEEQLDFSAEDLEVMRSIAGQIEMEQLMRYLRVFSEMSNKIRYATAKRVTVELAVIKLTTPQMETDMEALLDRIRVLEKKIEEGTFSLSEEQLQMINSNAAYGQKEAESVVNREEIIQKSLTPAEVSDMKNIMAAINEMRKDADIRREMGMINMALFDQASINIGEDKKSIVLSFDQSDKGKMAEEQFLREKNLESFKNKLGELTGKQVEVSCRSKQKMTEEDILSINFANVNFDVLVEE